MTIPTNGLFSTSITIPLIQFGNLVRSGEIKTLSPFSYSYYFCFQRYRFPHLLSCLYLLNYAQSELFLLARHTSDCITPAPLCIGAAHARPHRRGGVFRRLLRQSNRNSKRKRHKVAFFPLAYGVTAENQPYIKIIRFLYIVLIYCNK